MAADRPQACLADTTKGKLHAYLRTPYVRIRCILLWLDTHFVMEIKVQDLHKSFGRKILWMKKFHEEQHWHQPTAHSW